MAQICATVFSSHSHLKHYEHVHCPMSRKNAFVPVCECVCASVIIIKLRIKCEENSHEKCHTSFSQFYWQMNVVDVVFRRLFFQFHFWTRSKCLFVDGGSLKFFFPCNAYIIYTDAICQSYMANHDWYQNILVFKFWNEICLWCSIFFLFSLRLSFAYETRRVKMRNEFNETNRIECVDDKNEGEKERVIQLRDRWIRRISGQSNASQTN